MAEAPESGIACGYCARPAEFVRGADLHPHRPEIVDRGFWRCVPCAAWVGCHPGTTSPLGSLADARLRSARMRAHDAFDALWRGEDARMTRKQAYAWLASELGVKSSECHIAMFDAETCAKVTAFASKASHRA